MNQRAAIFNHFCEDLYKQKMTIEERAKLMTELYEDLGYEEYNLLDENGEYKGRDIQKAINTLKVADET